MLVQTHTRPAPIVTVPHPPSGWTRTAAAPPTTAASVSAAPSPAPPPATHTRNPAAARADARDATPRQCGGGGGRGSTRQTAIEVVVQSPKTMRNQAL